MYIWTAFSYWVNLVIVKTGQQAIYKLKTINDDARSQKITLSLGTYDIGFSSNVDYTRYNSSLATITIN